MEENLSSINSADEYRRVMAAAAAAIPAPSEFGYPNDKDWGARPRARSAGTRLRTCGRAPTRRPSSATRSATSATSKTPSRRWSPTSSTGRT